MCPDQARSGRRRLGRRLGWRPGWRAGSLNSWPRWRGEDVNEHDWLTSPDPTPMLAHLQERHVSERKLRLLLCGCCRQIWDLLPDRRSRDAVEVAERFADGEATPREL